MEMHCLQTPLVLLYCKGQFRVSNQTNAHVLYKIPLTHMGMFKSQSTASTQKQELCFVLQQ